MRILIANDLFYPDLNGSAYFTLRLADALMKRGHDVLMVTASRSFRCEYSERMGVRVFGLSSFPVFHYTALRIAFPFLSNMRLTDEVKKFNPDVIHIQGHSVIGRKMIKTAKKLGIPIMGTNHFMPDNIMPYIKAPKWLEEKLKSAAWRDLNRVYGNLSIVTTPTNTAASLMKKYGFPKEIHAVSNGIDLKRFRRGDDAGFLKERFSLPDKPTLLFVGRLDKEKYVDEVIRALAKIDDSAAPHFLVCGRGYEQERLKQLAEDLKISHRVTFAGFVPDADLQYAYRLADAFVMAGIAELQSLVTMESMASGLPVIAVDATALPELVRHGQNGFLFQHGDTAGLADCITKMFSDKQMREEMGRKSLEIIQHHDIEKVIRKFEGFYGELMKR